MEIDLVAIGRMAQWQLAEWQKLAKVFVSVFDSF